jgi:hypothetical protein
MVGAGQALQALQDAVLAPASARLAQARTAWDALSLACPYARTYGIRVQPCLEACFGQSLPVCRQYYVISKKYTM